MNFRRLIQGVARRPWRHWDIPFVAVYGVYKRFSRKDDINTVETSDDIELDYYQFRLNDVLLLLSRDSEKSVLEECCKRLESGVLAVDAYTASQQICNLFYLYQHLDNMLRDTFSSRLKPYIEKNAQYLLQAYEYKTNNIWFTNHLINNYRALLIYKSFFCNEGTSELEYTLHKIDNILYRYRSTVLYDGTLFLSEGSTSYEILLTRHFFEMANIPHQSGKFLNLIKSQLPMHLENFKDLYARADHWLFPWFGDLCPDIRRDDITLFLSAIYDQQPNVYQQVWENESS